MLKSNLVDFTRNNIQNSWIMIWLNFGFNWFLEPIAPSSMYWKSRKTHMASFKHIVTPTKEPKSWHIGIGWKNWRLGTHDFIHAEFHGLQLSIPYNMPLASSNVPHFSITPLIPSPSRRGIIVGPFSIKPNFPLNLFLLQHFKFNGFI